MPTPQQQPAIDPQVEAGLEPFDDGFEPSTCKQPTRLLRQPKPSLLPAELMVLPEAIGEAEALEVFNFTSGRDEPWGTYLPLEGESDGELQLAPKGAEPEVERIAAACLRAFWRTKAGELLRPDMKHVHGFSVWAVAGHVGDMTAYHMDYAEVFRRRNNIVAPAIHAATLQVSPVEAGDIEGGTFGAHVGGLEHYQHHGYKVRKMPPNDGAPTNDWAAGEGWTFAPYAFRQATLSDGTLPHAASRLVRWPAGVKRVVVGINSMGFTEGPFELETPQHSAAFRRMLKLDSLCQNVKPEMLAQYLLKVRRQKKAAEAAAKAAGEGADAAPAVAA